MPRDIRPLTSLRGIAALLVVVFHARLVIGDSLDFDVLTGFFAGGYLWVDFFFVLSGFVITGAYARDIHGGGLAAYGRFLWRRLARIYPLHVFVLLALVPTELAKYVIGWHDRPPFAAGNTVGELVGDLALVHSWGVYDHLTWNWPSWSISAEWAAYLMFPLLLPLFHRVRVATALLALPSLLAGLAALAAFHGGGLDATFDLGAVRCLLGFALGMATFRLFEAARGLAGAPVCDWLLAAAMAWVALAPHLALPAVLAVPGFVGVVLFAALGRGALARLLSAAPLHHLGEISYSIYLVQYPVQRVWHMAVRELAGGRLAPWAAGLSLAAALGLVVALATLTHRWVERPTRRYLVDHPPRPLRPAGARRPA